MATAEKTTERVKRSRHRGVTVLFEPDDLVRHQVGGFANFLKEYAVVGLALGFIVGQQANAVVKQFVDSFINPWVQIIFGQDLSNRVAIFHHNTSPVRVPWGAFAYTLIEFFVVLVSMYVAIKLLGLDRFAKKPGVKVVVPEKEMPKEGKKPNEDR